jgi:LemA protein
MKILIGLVVVLLLIGLPLMSGRNDLVTQREAVKGQWANTESALQRRADLIPNLVETVKGFAKQEQSVIDSVTKARAALVGAKTPNEKMAANDQLSGALSRLLVVVEQYPQLKSNENFLALQNELAGTENRINVERRKYNEVLQKYNTEIDLFPKNIAAKLFGFERMDQYFNAEPGANKAPQVKF